MRFCLSLTGAGLRTGQNRPSEEALYLLEGMLDTFLLPVTKTLPQIYLSSFKLFQRNSRAGYFPAVPAFNPPQMEEGRPAARRASLCLLISSETLGYAIILWSWRPIKNSARLLTQQELGWRNGRGSAVASKEECFLHSLDSAAPLCAWCVCLYMYFFCSSWKP